MYDIVTPDHLMLAGELADVAGKILMRHYRQRPAVEHKQDKSPVTAADREAEQAMRYLIERHCPEHGILGEEFGGHAMDADYLWVIDPIDGTRSFISGIPLFTTLIALTYQGKPMLGLIDQPVTGERWIGMAGGNCRMNGQIVRTRPCPALFDATVSTTSPFLLSGRGWEVFAQAAKKARITLFGGDAYAYAQIASGNIDLIIEEGLKPYDYAALAPVIESAGGVVTDWQGQPITLASDGTILAAGDAALHQQAMKLLGGKRTVSKTTH